MRHEASVTSISWIPSEAMSGPLRVPVDLGIGHYDPPPPDVIDDLAALRESDRFRFANHLAAYVDVEDGRIVDAGYTGGGLIGATTLRMAGRSVTIPAVAYPELQSAPEVGVDNVRFVQTAGGRTGAPLPRRINRPPFIQITAPTAWTTLALTIGADGSSSFEVVGASPFPRHWFYDGSGALARKSGVIDFSQWAAEQTHDRSPWHDVEVPAEVADVETATERDVSLQIMGATCHSLRKYREGEELVRQGEPAVEVMLVLDGLTDVVVDGAVVAEAGPGSILGERAALEGGRRTATVRARTAVKVAIVAPDTLDAAALAEVAAGHHRESRYPEGES
ncbi:MAG TPA: cyclic nucleotide-binding domain-containing protein [Acidimicrobiia bacterium]